MGCSLCADKPRDMVCNNCKDWATDLAERTHGRMVKDTDTRINAMKIVMMRYEGSINDDEAGKLFSQLFAR